MIKVFSCPDEGFCEYKTRKAIEKDNPSLDEMNFSRYDCYQNSLSDIVSDCLSLTFTGDTKVVLMTNCYFVSEASPQGDDYQTSDDFKAFLKYLEKPNPSTNLYLILTGKAGKSPIAKALKKVGEFTDIPALNLDNLALEGKALARANRCEMDLDAAKEVASRVSLNWNAYLNSVNKLCLYTGKITMNEVDLLVKKKPEDNVFSISNALLSGNGVLAVSKYRDLRKGGLNGLAFLGILYAQFSFMAQVAFLVGKGYNDNAIASKLGCSSGRVYMNKKNLVRIQYRSLIAMLADLGCLEKNVKFDLDDIDMRLELFFLQFKEHYLMY